MNNENSPKAGGKLHWPTIILGIIIAIVFLVAIFSYQVKSTQIAVISTLGKVVEEPDAGLHFRWPYPIQKIYYFDRRQRCFEGSVGRIEETFTADEQNIIVGIYVKYRIEDAVKLFKSEKTIESAELKMNSLMRSDKDRIVGKYKFSQFINTDKDKMKISQIENDIKLLLSNVAHEKYGLKIEEVGIKNLGIPRKVTRDVIARMIADRKAKSGKILSEGEKVAKNIRTEADAKKDQIIAKAEALAEKIKAEGDAEAASSYAVFNQKPELAIFLKQLDSLKNISKSKTVLVLDTDTAPFNLLKQDAEKLMKANTENKKK